MWVFYEKTLRPMLTIPGKARNFLLMVLVAFVLSALLAVFRIVPLKLLPFDNKNELQIVIDMPRGSSLEETDATALDLGEYISRARTTAPRSRSSKAPQALPSFQHLSQRSMALLMPLTALLRKWPGP